MWGDSSVAGEGSVVGVSKFHSWGKCTMAINEYQLRLGVQCFLWRVYYLFILCGSFKVASWCVIHYNICDPLSEIQHIAHFMKTEIRAEIGVPMCNCAARKK